MGRLLWQLSRLLQNFLTTLIIISFFLSFFCSLLPGKMFPTRGDLHVAPFFDDALYMEHFSKANFWLVFAVYNQSK